MRSTSARSGQTNWLRLTRRWLPLRYHPEQYRLYHEPKRFKICPAGRRSGKTELAKRFLVMQLWEALSHPRPWTDPRFFAAAPTRDQAKRIFWTDLKALVPAAWRDGDPRESDMLIRTKWGAELWVLGLDVPARVEGTPWDGGVIDELANCRPGTWDAHIRPSLSDREGWAWMIGVPDRDAPAQVEYKQRYEDVRAGKFPEWGVYHWPSKDILNPAEVASAMQTMDAELFEQEYGGRFVLAGGLAFPTFDYRTHVRDDVAAYDPSLPLCWALDFNVDPMCSGIIQDYRGQIRVIDELVLHDSQTEVACDAFLDLVAKNRWSTNGLRIYGDATGNARDSTSGESDWTIVKNKLRNHAPTMRVPSAQPSIKDTLNAVRAKLKSADGTVKLVVNSRCRQLISDFGAVLWPSDMAEGHCLAWLRYMITRDYPVKVEAPVSGNRGFAAAPAR